MWCWTAGDFEYERYDLKTGGGPLVLCVFCCTAGLLLHALQSLVWRSTERLVHDRYKRQSEMQAVQAHVPSEAATTTTKVSASDIPNGGLPPNGGPSPNGDPSPNGGLSKLRLPIEAAETPHRDATNENPSENGVRANGRAAGEAPFTMCQHVPVPRCDASVGSRSGPAISPCTGPSAYTAACGGPNECAQSPSSVTAAERNPGGSDSATTMSESARQCSAPRRALGATDLPRTYIPHQCFPV